MSHTTKIVKTQQLSDEAVAVTIRCCDNKLTDSVLTIYDVGKLSPEQLTKDIDKHHDRCAEKCASMASGKTLLDGLVKKTKTHGGK
jgi:hypothetical protein